MRVIVIHREAIDMPFVHVIVLGTVEPACEHITHITRYFYILLKIDCEAKCLRDSGQMGAVKTSEKQLTVPTGNRIHSHERNARAHSHVWVSH